MHMRTDSGVPTASLARLLESTALLASACRFGITVAGSLGLLVKTVRAAPKLEVQLHDAAREQR